MNLLLRRIHLLIGRLNEFVGTKISWLNLILVLLVGVDVMYRRALNNTQTWIMEMEWHIFALIFLLGAGYAFKHDRHVRVDLFYAKFEAKDKALVNLIGGVLFLVPWCALLALSAFKFGMDALRIREVSPDPGGLPARYLIKFSIALGALLLLLQGVASIMESILILRGSKDFGREEDMREHV